MIIVSSVCRRKLIVQIKLKCKKSKTSYGFQTNDKMAFNTQQYKCRREKTIVNL